MPLRKILRSSLILALLGGGLNAKADFDKFRELLRSGDAVESRPGEKSATSSVRVYPKLGIVAKQVNEFLEYGVFEREVNTLQRLRGLKHIPKLLYVDFESNTFYMEYGGNKINKQNLPKDWKIQVKEIISELRERGVYHNDIKDAEVLVNDKGIIMLIDYGWSAPSPAPKDIGSPIAQRSYDVTTNLRNGIGASFKAPGAQRDDRFSLVKAVQVTQGLPSDGSTVAGLIKDIFETRHTYDVVAALYGTDSKAKDVTAAFKTGYARNPRFIDGHPHSLNKLFGDPAPGMPKRLTINYKMDGADLTYKKTIGEGDSFSF